MNAPEPRAETRPPGDPILEVSGLRKYFPVRGGILNRTVAQVQAVDGVDFHLERGETLGIVGESGCGKSTTARLLMRLIDPDAGDIYIDGNKVGDGEAMTVRDMRRQMQMVFQDSYSSLNPRLPCEETIAFGPKGHGLPPAEARERARHLLAKVGLEPNLFIRRYPHELSGGQRQRINIARALALDPRIVILDEAVSALDKSVQAQVLNLLGELKRELGLTYIFISHDLHVVEYISDRILVMYLGKVVEIGSVALFSAMPSNDPDRRKSEPPLFGDPPNPINPPSGCRFHTRCPHAEPVCSAMEPRLRDGSIAPGHMAACHMAIAGSGHSKAGSGAA
jgi:peptide/nickel transport system ATP-binding protein